VALRVPSISKVSRICTAAFLVSMLSTASVALQAQPSAAATHRCHPLTNSGRCYEPGEYCRHTDRGVRGIAGDGKRIICRNNDGLRWEPY
jgi:hypothetical protein